MKSFLSGFVSALALIAVIASLLIYTGRAPVSAAEADTPFLDWLLHTSFEQALERHASDVAVPAANDSQPQLFRGARSFAAMCSGCHLPPGAAETPYSAGLRPSPPELVELMAERTPAEAFWVINNGVHFTGMPAIGLTHSDEEIWAVVDFLERAKTMTGDDYQRIVELAQAAQPQNDGHEH